MASAFQNLKNRGHQCIKKDISCITIGSPTHKHQLLCQHYGASFCNNLIINLKCNLIKISPGTT